MDSCPTLDEVYQAVYTLYHNPDTSENGKASLWLGAFQKSIYSWKIADEILHEKRDLESCYLAAQTMRSKIQLSFHELPVAAHDSLRDSLLQHVSQINDSTNPIIITQLCLALADLALQMSSWQRPVVDLITKFGAVHVWPLLEILTVLPEELNSSSLRLGANRRQRVKEDLMVCASSVSEFLTACLAGAGENAQIHTRIFRCFTSWVNIRAVSFPDAAKNVVVGNAFQVLSDHQAEWSLHSSAMECVCALFRYLEDKNDQPELEEQLFSTVMALEKSFSLLLSYEGETNAGRLDQCRSSPVKVSGIKSKYMNYCQLFTELGESFLVKILDESGAKEQHFAIKIFDVILTCVEHHDYQMAEITFNLWYRLSEELYHRRDAVLTLLFKPHIEKLIAALCQHCQMEPDQDSLLDEDDDFADFRKKVSELIKDVVFIVGSSNCFHFMFKRVNQPGVTWQSSEAALYVMQTVAKNIVPEENDVVPQVLEAVWSLPENTHITVKYTSVLLLGELCDWIEDHPHLIEHVLNFLLYSLQQPLLASAAAVSLQSICTACRNHMIVHFSGLLQIIQTLDSFNITNEAAVGLLKGVASIVGKMPDHQLQQALKDICYLQINPLCQLVNGNMSTTRGTKTDPVVWLDRLTVLVRHSSPKAEDGTSPPCLVVINDIWPILSKTCVKYQADPRIMERWCRCLRFTVRSLGKQSVFLFQPLVEQIVQLYQTHQHSCFLYLGSILVDELPATSEEHYIQGLLDMLQAFIPPTFAILQEPKGLLNHPDTIDDFFRLNYRFLRSLPVPYLQGPAIVSIVQCALLAISLDHRDANSSVMKFLFELIHCGWSHQDRGDFQVRHKLVEDILIENGQSLISNLIHACVFCLHSYMFAEVADVIMELLDCDRTLVSSWLGVAIGDLPKQNSGGSDTATHEQLAAFHHTLTKADGAAVVKSALREFVVLFR